MLKKLVLILMILLVPVTILGKENDPGGAFWRNLLIPGWGSLYAHRPIRALVHVSLVGGFTYLANQQNELYRDHEGLFQENKEPYDEYLAEIYHEQRNDMIWWMGIMWMGCALDVYVAEHLRDMKKAKWEGFSLAILPNKISLSYHFDSFSKRQIFTPQPSFNEY